MTDDTPVLWYLRNGVRHPCDKDWALYDGFVGETGSTTVEFRVRSSPQTLSPQSPKTFFDLHFFGAEEGMAFTLHKESSVEVAFAAGPGYGQMLSFKDIAGHRVTQQEVLDALQQMFNLRFFTEEATRTVVVEPEEAFFRRRTIADWSRRRCDGTPVETCDRALDLHDSTALSYLAPDGRTARGQDDSQPPFGTWKAETGTFASKMGCRQLRNPLFHPVMSVGRQITTAPSALLLSVGDRDATDDDGVNFPMTVVRYFGMHPLPESEKWCAATRSDRYPLAAFHFRGDNSRLPATLCFEDRDGAKGLHSYYDRQLEEMKHRERVTLRMWLPAAEAESLLLPTVAETSIRSLFAIDIGEGRILAHLDKIDDYNPDDGTAQCTFVRILQD